MSGGKKKRKELEKGREQYNQFANQAVAQYQPFQAVAAPATNQLSALLGISGNQAAATADFENSPFYAAGQNAFGLEKDAVDSTLSNSGLLYSQARLGAVEDARQRNYSNAFQNYLGATQGLANFGLAGAAGAAGVYGGQGNAALGVSQGKANTRNGFLGTLKDITEIGRNVAGGFTGF